jgi:epoxyqueuosine reductase
MAAQTKNGLSDLIKAKSESLGFDICGIAKARSLSEYKTFLEDWCSAGMNDTMKYLARDFEKRTDPGILFPGARSLVVTGLSYYSNNKQKFPDAPVISRYAYGKEYQGVITGKLNELLKFIKTIDPRTEGKAFADTAPLMEKAWAVEAGLGWQGRHSIVINRNIGSFFFIGILVLNIDLQYDEPHRKEYCGDCRLCIDNCPTAAINSNKTIDARKCISNLTIENRGPIPEDYISKLGGRVYACDKCQEVCPWNKDAKPNSNPEFALPDEIRDMSKEEWLSLSEARYNTLFSGTPIGRVRYERFRRNIEAVIKENQGR